ncbi:hypothetical protein S83_055068 [Arachis hypogaea]
MEGVRSSRRQARHSRAHRSCQHGSGERDCRRRSYSFGASPEITTWHMDKQNEILMEAYKSMLDESKKLQIRVEGVYIWPFRQLRMVANRKCLKFPSLLNMLKSFFPAIAVEKREN